MGHARQSPSSVPQAFWLLLATQAPLHRWKPVLQRGTHLVPSQVETPPVMVGHAMQVLPHEVLLRLLSGTQVRFAAVPHP